MTSMKAGMDEKPNSILRVFDRLLDILNAICGGIMVFVMFSIAISVATRYFFAKPIGWSQEIGEYSIVCVTFLGLAWVLKVDGHVVMDIIFNYISPKTKALLNTITSSVCIVVCFLLANAALKVAINQFILGQTTYTILAPPKGLFTSIIMLGLFLVALQFIRRTWGYILAFKAECKVVKG